MRSSAVSLVGLLLLVPLAACSVAGSAQPDVAAMSTVTAATIDQTGPAADKTQRTTDPAAETATTAEVTTAEESSLEDGSDDSGSAALPDACDLLTHEEANTLAGRTLQDAVPAGLENGAYVACQYTSDPNEPGVAQ